MKLLELGVRFATALLCAALSLAAFMYSYAAGFPEGIVPALVGACMLLIAHRCTRMPKIVHSYTRMP